MVHQRVYHKWNAGTKENFHLLCWNDSP